MAVQTAGERDRARELLRHIGHHRITTEDGTVLDLTTEQAASLLGISRPTVVRMIDAGISIPIVACRRFEGKATHGNSCVTHANRPPRLRPGGHLRPDSALRTLRDNGLAAEPISVVPRTGRGANGRLVWYSSLMLDVARLLRVGGETASDVHQAADSLAGHGVSRFLTEALLEAGRQKFQTTLGIEWFIGRVAGVSGRVGFVVADDGRTLPIPTSLTSPNLWAGALVAVDTELFPGGGTTVWVRPAFDSEADSNERVPGDRRLLTAAERNRLTQPVASSR